MPHFGGVPRLGGDIGELLFERGLSLPCSVSLTERQQEDVIEAVAGAIRTS
jgi:dTDP-4-amino-4,6-dideoxygalactose transaminase